MSRQSQNEENIRKGRRRFIGAGAGFLGLAWTTQASAAWQFFCRPCFLAGTRIETEAGLVAVEALREGDLVKTLDGSFKPIRWIGHFTVEKPDSGSWAKNDVPVLIKRGAFGKGAPHTDLRVSGHHAFYFDGVLVKVKDLVNGINVCRDVAFSGEELAYYHVELDAHDVIFAEGAPTETFRAHGDNQRLFDNGDEAISAPGAFTAPFAPMLSLSRKEQAVVSIKSALLPWRNHAGRIGEIRAMIARHADHDHVGAAHHAA